MEPDSLSSLAYVAGVERGRGRENLSVRESVWGAQRGKERSVPFLSPSRAPHALARAQIPPSPSPFNAGHAGY